MNERRPSVRLAIGNSSDIVTARQAARELSAHLGFGKAHQTRLATAVSELTRNVIQYAGAGSCLIEDLSDPGERMIRITIEDHGPGIPDLTLALQDGFSTSGGLGAGLPGVRRLVDSFHISSNPGLTRIVIAIRKPV
ncbi:anti-sigma regulatory factor [Ectothiorhodospira shaposhnikovii]|uniref:anti-sigma regulatory factor n=1 Tax=Ectothiorhodospira shaposhnikovii TaxID=1054 RepID=UPI001EE7954D|nr:anti-sigma regulatory factor [Ectothiorhodospira shaposhnikovii]MCG5511876.1 anti-sigma regulatory factor [Ectothiorhodospira shaposhnikovii]